MWHTAERHTGWGEAYKMWIHLSLLITCYLTPCKALTSIAEYADENSFNELIKNNDYVVAFLHEGQCENQACLNMDKLLSEVKQDLLDANIQLTASSEASIVGKYNVQGDGEILFFRKTQPAVYKGLELEKETFVDWVQRALQAQAQSLNEDNFEHLTQAATGATTGDWFVMFYEHECSVVNSLMPLWETLAIRLKGKANVATVDVSKNTALRKRFNIEKCPTLIYFRLGNMYTYSLQDLDFNSLTAFADGWYKNEKAVKVLLDASPFDQMTENIAKSLKESMKDPKQQILIFGGAGLLFIVILTVLICTCKPKKAKAD